MSSATTARLWVGLTAALTTFITALLFFHSLRSSSGVSVQKLDLWILLFGLSILLGGLGIGVWLGAIFFVVAMVLLGLSGLMGGVGFWMFWGILIGFAFLSYRILSGIQLFLSRQSAVMEECEERCNDLQAKLTLHQAQKEALEQKISRYQTLKEFTSQLSRNLSLAEVISKTLAQAVGMIPTDQQTCLLYLVDRQQQELSLQGSYRQNGQTIKHKKGDLLDYWVFKHRQPILVEDIQKDFRFNINDFVEGQNSELRRPFRSLISVPLIDEKGIMGVLRKDGPNPNQFRAEDLRLLAIIADLSTTAIRNATLFAMTQELAIKDGLTGLYVHRYLIQRLGEEIQRAFRSGDYVSLILMDIDWFKKYNDRFGHISGDLVLKQLGRRLLDFIQPGEMAARYGGEEFAIVLPGCDAKVTFERTEKLRQIIETDIFWLRQQPTRVTASLGVATFPMEAKDREDLIRFADQALYKAKAGGRNRTCSHSLS